MKQRIARASLFWLQISCIVVLGAPNSVRAILYRQFYPLVEVEAHDLAAPPSTLADRGYRQDDPLELAAFRAIAQSAVAGATTDGQRLRQLGDMLYRWRRPDSPLILGGREKGVHALLGEMQRGDHGLCGHMTLVFAALWRSMGRDFREIRFTASDDAAWYAAHYGIEVYLPDTRQWLYYDMGLNGYAVDGAGRPLSLSALDEHLASGHNVALVASTQYQDWDPATFMDVLRQQPLQVFSLNNRLRPLDPDRRFGRLNFARDLFASLPRPIDRVVDALTGDAAPRMTLSRRSALPAAQAMLHLTASPGGQAPFP